MPVLSPHLWTHLASLQVLPASIHISEMSQGRGRGNCGGDTGQLQSLQRPLLTLVLWPLLQRWWAPPSGEQVVESPQGQPGLQGGSFIQQRGLMQVEVSADIALSHPFWTGTWPRTLSSVTVTSSGWRTSCAPTPSRRAEPAAPAPGASPTSASGRSRARSSGAQVAACARSSACTGTVMFPGWLQQGCPRVPAPNCRLGSEWGLRPGERKGLLRVPREDQTRTQVLSAQASSLLWSCSQPF